MDKHNDETVERVARAICNSISIDQEEGSCTCDVDGGTCCAMDLFGVQARAALSAIPAPADDGPTFGPLDPASQNLGTWEPARDDALALRKEEAAHLQTIDERDIAQATADRLADLIAKMTGVEIGEHSAGLGCAGNDPHLNAIDAAEAFLRALPARDDGWMPIETAPKDGTRILALFHADIYPRIRPQREDLEGWNGAQAVVRHPGTYELDGRTWDHGWNIAGPVGVGGLPDEWFAGWRPLSAPPAPAQEPRS